jgi:UDP-N-acetylglucosamine transferase subunit ALG13
MDVPLVVVPNPDLLDNHQVELADVLAEQGYVIRGTLGYVMPSLIQVTTTIATLCALTAS